MVPGSSLSAICMKCQEYMLHPGFFISHMDNPTSISQATVLKLQQFVRTGSD
jgi:hypothetical protein